MFNGILICTLALLLSAFGDPTQTSDDPFEPKVKPTIRISSTESRIDVDGRLDDEAWKTAATATGFSEVQPGNRTEALVETQTFVTYDERFLYIGFRALDDPSSIRATLRGRDEAFQDDWVGVILDTFGDAGNAYEIFANPLGIQMDGLMSNGGNEDMGFDIVFYSEGTVTENGYEVEMALPFSSLRFPDREVQNWNVTFIRNHPRETRRIYSWAAVDQENACLLCQLGSIEGMQGVRPGTQLQLMPAMVGSQSASLVESENPSSGLDNDRLQPELSLNMRYDFTPSVAAEATLNPDFSQIESDAAQIDVNSTFALFYPERRPFFQEGSDLFRTWLDVVYTRSINDPIAAAKLTGRVGRTSIAYLSAVDEHSPVLVPLEERSHLVEGGRSLSNILRARHSFGSNSFVGALVTDRRLLDGGSGTTVSADMKLQFHKQYSVMAQLALSDTREPDASDLSDDFESSPFADARYTSALDGESFRGYGMFLELDRSSRHWNFEVNYRGYSPTFRTGNGFVRRNDYHEVEMEQRVNLYPKWGFADVISPGIDLSRQVNFDGEWKMDEVQPYVNMQLKGQTYVYLAYEMGRERFEGIDFDGVGGGVMHVNSNFSEKVSAGFFVFSGREIARNEDIPQLGDELVGGVFLNLKPVQRLIINPSVNFARLTDRNTGEDFYRGYIVRTQVSFQFMRELSLRVITQYNDFSKRWDVEPLLAYQLNPFSVFYLGSAHDFNRFDDPLGYAQTDRQLFFKFQYLFQR